MRVLVVVPNIDSYGGTRRFLERLMLLHQQQGFATALLVPSHLYDISLANTAARYGTQVISAPSRTTPQTAPFLTPLLDFQFSWRAVRSWCPDLLVVSSSDPGRMSVALYFPVPVLYILHSVPELAFRLLPRLYLRFGFLLNNQTMTVSAAAARAVEAMMGIPRHRVSVVYNSTPPARQALPAAEPFVVTAGHLVSYKNPQGWLEVAQAVLRKRAEVTFVWLGDGEQLASLREAVKALGLEERVLLPGFVADPSAWFEKAQIYFQPSLRESHGIAVLEAMARGLPCVAADTGGLPESVLEGVTGYLCPSRDTASFADQIVKLLDDPALRESLGAAGRLRATREFGELQQQEKILALYGHLMAKREPK